MWGPSLYRDVESHLVVSQLRLFLCWPNVERTGNNQGFWAGEWHRHGGCSELQYDQLRYFELAADLYDQHFDIFGVLTRASVPRSYVNSVPLATTNSSIIANTTKVPVLTCRWYQDPASGGWGEILKEVFLYLDKQFVLIDCPPRNSYNDCISPDIYFV
ncbi:hypothetical protein Vadar_012166 [Vaccinium darrowii]|uniref:Uncharacterized protein n=1 Tax=Vaccinium darrowii TaxID=229202 RepID=A0ACB7Z4U1_9ERIC|nr:hypothetical protein Vadar_012166 [Vaccinium darrowii]